MTREEKIKLAIDKGITYDPTTGKIYGVRGNEIKRIKNGYVYINITHNNKQISLTGHQFAYYKMYNKTVDCIDHINGIRNDNRICNLRSVTNQENTFNQIGKGFIKIGDKYKSVIKLNYKKITIGYFDTEQEAHKAYLDAKKIYHKI